MNKLSNWTARRSGDGITITHATGKVKVETIEPSGSDVIGVSKDGTKFLLMTSRAAEQL